MGKRVPLKARGQQCTNSTHVLAAIRTLNRLESVGETLRAALNRVATVAPDWLTGVAGPEWFERYAIRVEEYRLPKGEAARTALGEPIGVDGHTLLAAVYAPAAPAGLRELPAFQTLRQVWAHQFWVEDGVVRWRKAADPLHSRPTPAKSRCARTRTRTRTHCMKLCRMLAVNKKPKPGAPGTAHGLESRAPCPKPSAPSVCADVDISDWPRPSFSSMCLPPLP